jgi:hypothetical protein
LVSEEEFIAVQAIHTAPIPADGTTRSPTLARLVFCGMCGRVMDSHWVHQAHAAADDPRLAWAARKSGGRRAAVLRRRRAAIVVDRTQWTVELPSETFPPT